ncbi:MAG: beta-propeller fold lactonase family protein [Terracidiphilus sp.]
MKFSKLSQLFLVSAIGLFVATLLTACEIVTIDYLFVANSAGSGSSSAGQIQTYDADSETGALRVGQPAVPSGGSNPVSLAVTADYAHLYAANAGNNSVVHFALDGNGVLTQKDTVTASGTPASIGVNTADTYLYVLSGTTSATLTEYSLSSGVIGTAANQVALTVPGYAGDTIVPTGVTVLANNNNVYVTVYDQSAYNPGGTTTSTANPGWIFGYSVGAGGALSPVAGSPWKAGVKPTALASDPTSRFLYATDFASNQLIGFTIQSGGVLDFLINGPFKTGNEPSAICIDPRGKYIYVSNSLDSSVTAYTIDLSTGTPTGTINVTGSQVNATDTQPVAILVDPALGRFVYTANHIGDSISGFLMNTDTGAISQTQATPYPTGAGPTALAAVPHGNHSLQVTTP